MWMVRSFLDSLGGMYDDLKSSQSKTISDTEEAEFWCTVIVIYLFCWWLWCWNMNNKLICKIFVEDLGMRQPES